MLPYKNYRADVKGKYEKYLKVSFIISLILLIAAFKFSPKPVKIENKEQNNDSDIILVKPPIHTKIYTKPPSMPKPVVPVIAINNETEDLIMVDISIDETSEYSKPLIIHREKIVEDDKIFVAVEEMPEILGGMKSLYSKLIYPDIIRRAEIEGKVIIEFIVDKNGNVVDMKIIQSVNDKLDEIALNAVKDLKFTPGKQRGKPVKVKMKIPINFRLK